MPQPRSTLFHLVLLSLLCPPLEAKEATHANPIPALLRRLDAPATRLEACRELEKLEDRVPEARALLLETFRGKETERRLLAAYGLGCLRKQGAPAVPDLIAALVSGEPSLRAAACLALSQIAFASRTAVMPALPELSRLLRDPDARVRESAADAIGELRPPRPAVAAELRRLSRDPVDVVRAAALASLLKLGRATPELVRALSVELGAKTARARMTAVHALGGTRAAARPALAQLARVAKSDADLELRRAALGAIGAIGKPSPEVVKLLSEALKERDVKQAALAALAECAPRVAAAELEKALADTDAEVRAEAIGGLASDAVERLVPQILRACKDPAPAVRLAAIQALRGAKRDRMRVVSALRAALRDEDSEVRDASLISLQVLGPAAAAALPDLIALLGQRDSAGLAAAALARQGARASAALPTLYGWTRSPDPKLRARGAVAVSSIEPRREKACAALKPLVADSDHQVRASASWALKRLGCAAARP